MSKIRTRFVSTLAAAGLVLAGMAVTAEPASAATNVCNSSASTRSLQVYALGWNRYHSWLYLKPGQCRWDPLGDILLMKVPPYHKATTWEARCRQGSVRLSRWQSNVWTVKRGSC